MWRVTRVVFTSGAYAPCSCVDPVRRNAEQLARLAHIRNRHVRRARDRMLVLAGRPTIVRRQIRAAQQIDPAKLLQLVRHLSRSTR